MIDQSHLQRCPPERLRGGQPTKPRTDDYDPRWDRAVRQDTPHFLAVANSHQAPSASGVNRLPPNRPGRGYADVDAYPADPAAAEAEAFGYWKANKRPFQAAAFAALVARRIAETARDGLKGQRK